MDTVSVIQNGVGVHRWKSGTVLYAIKLYCYEDLSLMQIMDRNENVMDWWQKSKSQAQLLFKVRGVPS